MQALRPLLSSERYLPMLIVTADDTPQRQAARPGDGRPRLPRQAVRQRRGAAAHPQPAGDAAALRAARTRAAAARAGGRSSAPSALANTHLEIVERLARAAEYRDDNTGEHTRRVGRLAGADRAHARPERRPTPAMIERAAPLHDVGKVGVPDAILLKPGAALARRARHHQDARDHGRDASCRAAACRCCAWPRRLPRPTTSAGTARAIRTAARGEGIPLAGRIVALADAFDAMTHTGPIRRASPRARRSPSWRASAAATSIPRSSTPSCDVFAAYASSLAGPPRAGSSGRRDAAARTTAC